MASTAPSTAVLPTLFNEDSPDDYTIIVLRGYKGVTGKYKVNLHTTLEGLAELATSQDCPLKNVVLFFHGQRVLHSDSPASLGIENRSVVTIGYRMDFSKGLKENLLGRDHGNSVKLVVRGATETMGFIIGSNEPLEESLNVFAAKYGYGANITVRYNGFKVKASTSAKDLYVQKRHTFVVDVSPESHVNSGDTVSQEDAVNSRLKSLITPTSVKKATKRSINTKNLNSLKKKRNDSGFPSSPPRAHVIQKEASSDGIDVSKLPVTGVVSHKKVTRGFRFHLVFGGNVKCWKTGSEFKRLAPKLHKEYCDKMEVANVETKSQDDQLDA